jgi:hypothetical protein
MFRIGKRTVVMAVGVGVAIAGFLAFGNALISAFETLAPSTQAILEVSAGGAGAVTALGAAKKSE